MIKVSINIGLVYLKYSFNHKKIEILFDLLMIFTNYSIMARMSLGEVQELLINLRKVKQFYNRQLSAISSSIREHEKIETKLQSDHIWNSTDEEDADMSNEKTNRNPKRQKINQKIKIKVKKNIKN